MTDIQPEEPRLCHHCKQPIDNVWLKTTVLAQGQWFHSTCYDEYLGIKPRKKPETERGVA